jgi:cytochrome c oxidase accessory protein FixG
VFLEFLFRPIERLIEGNGAQRLKLDQSPWNFNKIIKKFSKHALCAMAAWIIANTALAYFVGREPLIKMMTDWPWNNPVPFTMSIVMMGLMAFQFGWFREQFCTVVCPYARFQSVLLDSHSLVVGYDNIRGEPRGKVKKGVSSENLGDCVDCGLCVRVCPTGIDIRNGIQLECIHCAACIDACDSVMTNLGRPTGLIRYDSEAGLHGERLKFLRPRVLVYALILVIIFSAFVYSLNTRVLSELRVVRGAKDAPYVMLPDGKITNHLHAKVSNKSNKLQKYTFSLEGQENIELITPLVPFEVMPESINTAPLFFNLKSAMLLEGKKNVVVIMKDEEGTEYKQVVTLLGPG